MKKINLLKTVLLFLITVIFLYGCREESFEKTNSNIHTTLLASQRHTHYSDFVTKTNINFLSKTQSGVGKKTSLILNAFVTDNFIVNTEDILLTWNKSNEPTVYSFYITPKEKSQGNIFYNLVFLKKKNGEWIYRVLKYIPNENYKPGHFQGNILQLFDSENATSKSTSQKSLCYYQIINSVGSCAYGHTTLKDCGGDTSCCASCWVVTQTAMMYCDQEGLEYPSNGGGFEINDGSGFSSAGGDSLVFLLDANYATKFHNLSAEISLYLVQNYEANLDLDFSKWSIDFFTQNSNVTKEQFQNWFINADGTPKISFDSTLNENNSLVVKSVDDLNSILNYKPISVISYNGINPANEILSDFKLRLYQFHDSGVQVFVKTANINQPSFKLSNVSVSNYGISLFHDSKLIDKTDIYKSSSDPTGNTYYFNMILEVNRKLFIQGIGTYHTINYNIVVFLDKKTGKITFVTTE